ncbi:hedgehog-interacting protein isoform X2 [Paralichthys olivaceus]|uniref:hedgehog-interacting protein isoform X2 n=1 Tax=Paralichthys olivaceus TaxID=8255 RepID=UPI00097DEE71|nr:PREDICTED: hedgehog-interacting protein isoform X2 [Paralichthys olivaceus]
MKHLQFVLVLAIAVNVWECGDAKFGERGEISPRRRRCYDGSSPKRLKKRERKVLLDGSGSGGGSSGEVCHRLYPRVSCCPTRRAAYQILHRRDARIFSTNNTECGRLLEEIKCARCSPNAQVLFHSSDMDKMPHREPDLPRLCHDFCREFYYTCRGHIPELFQADVDEFCQYYGRRDASLCFPDFQRKQPQGQDSNYLGDEKLEDISRKHKHNCYCAQEVLSGLRQPVSVVHCGDGSQRLFVLEREGTVRILNHDLELIKEPFLDLHKLVQNGLKGGDERGLLSLVFHPNYKKNGKLYVSYTTNQERWAIGPHDHILRVVEYTVSRKNPNQVDTRTVRVLMEVAELHRKHLGGQLLFGPDGLLHIILGDGMITLDDMEEMDGLSDFTGSVLRVDVDTDCCTSPYSIPRNNPYFNSTNQPPEIFAHGLHDPGRCAVDRLQTDNGSLLILCTDASGKNTTSGRILEITKGKDYENEPSVYDLQSSGGASPVGGFIYRGCQSRRLYGSYVFGDKNGNLRILQKSMSTSASGEQWQEKALCLGSAGSCGSMLVGHILGFGEDEQGEVYILASSKSMAQSHSGKLYKLVDPKRPHAPKECQRQVEPPELLMTACSRHCKNGHCTPTGKCCCSPGWEGPFCRVAKCEPACRNGGVCMEPSKCLCKSGYSGAQCEKSERGMPNDQEKDANVRTRPTPQEQNLHGNRPF